LTFARIGFSCVLSAFIVTLSLSLSLTLFLNDTLTHALLPSNTHAHHLTTNTYLKDDTTTHRHSDVEETVEVLKERQKEREKNPNNKPSRLQRGGVGHGSNPLPLFSPIPSLTSPLRCFV